jgi:hypothetical protein
MSEFNDHTTLSTALLQSFIACSPWLGPQPPASTHHPARLINGTLFITSPIEPPQTCSTITGRSFPIEVLQQFPDLLADRRKPLRNTPTQHG